MHAAWEQIPTPDIGRLGLGLGLGFGVVSLIQLMQSPWPLRADVQVAAYQALTEIYED